MLRDRIPLLLAVLALVVLVSAMTPELDESNSGTDVGVDQVSWFEAVANTAVMAAAVCGASFGPLIGSPDRFTTFKATVAALVLSWPVAFWVTYRFVHAGFDVGWMPAVLGPLAVSLIFGFLFGSPPDGAAPPDGE